MTRLVLIRHGETDWNREGRCQGQTDVPLNLTGRAQAAALAASLCGQQLDAVYSSDLLRASQTAQPVAHATRAPLFLDLRLREIHLGQWQGMLLDDVRAGDGARAERFFHDPQMRAGRTGESVADVFGRVSSALDEILGRHPGGRLAVVSHGLALAALKTRLLGVPLAAAWQVEPANAVAKEYELEAT